ncbi:MAG: biopolymer transporter ExbD [Gemmatimonadaceae bacterium]
MQRRRRREGMAVNGEINVVSLIDVMMLLMVIFMITAPLMQSGLDVNLPNADAPALESRNSVSVEVRRNGDIAVDGVKISSADFARTFKQLATRKGKDTAVTLQGDQSVPYGKVVEVFAMMIKSGITNIQMVTEPLDAGQR